MFLRKSLPFSFRLGFYAAVLSCLVACAPQPIQSVTPTPEIFNPLDPSPTPSSSSLPLTCQVTDLSVYVKEEWGYCFAYPEDFDVDESSAVNGVVNLYGPALEQNADPIRVSLEISAQPVPENSALTPLVDAYLSSFRNVTMPMPIRREASTLGSEPAESLEPVPGLLSSRVIMALHDDLLFTLRFHPSDIDFAEADLEELNQTVTGSFAFLAREGKAVWPRKIITWFEFGQTVSLSYDPRLAPWVQSQTVPAVPVSDQILFSESHPAFAQIRFLGFQGGRLYQLPVLPVEHSIAQVMVFQTADFSGFGDNNPHGFVNQWKGLKSLLETGLDPAFCGQPLTTEVGLPFLPWLNSKQSLCSQPEIIQFTGGRGIRYVTYYAQGVGPVLDQQIFYTFQGLTDDGQFYVSALFPVETGVFPTEAPACSQCGEADYNPLPEWEAELADQVTQLNALPEDEFAPALAVLDELIASIEIGQQ